MSGAAFPRRTLLKMAGAGAATALSPKWAFAGPFQSAEWPIPTDKKLSAEWIASLTRRGEPKRYSGADLQRIGMPVGGIGCGLVYLSGDGRLWQWDVFNRVPFGVYPGHTVYKGDDIDSGGGAAYVDPPKPHAPFEIGFWLQVDGGPEVPMDASGWPQVTFEGRYPIGLVRYASPALPVTVELCAASPWAPLEVEDSSLPVTVMEYRVTNHSNEPVKVTLGGRMQNPVVAQSGRPASTKLRVKAMRGGFQFDAYDVPPRTSPRADVPVEDFQHEGYGEWKATGTAFGSGPILKSKAPAYQGEFGGPGDRMVNSHASAPGSDVGARDAATGTLTSPSFTLSRTYLNFWIGGGNIPGQECLNLIVDGKVVASATGENRERMRPASFDLSAFQGKLATIQVVDSATGGWGHINLGPISLGDVALDAIPLPDAPDFGTMALALSGGNASQPAGEVPFGQVQKAAASRTVTIGPGETEVFTGYVAWHFPNLRLGLKDDESGRHYKGRFQDAASVIQHVQDRPELLARTKLWAKTWYDDSTLPHYFLMRTMSSASTLATSTCYRFGSGRFYAFEGVGCCAGTCTHVWQYAQAVGRLFPALERDTRERVDLGVGFVKETGEIWFRAEFDHSPAVDGQAGTILRFWREHQMAPDDGFLKRCWSRIRKSIEFLIQMDGVGDGLLKGPQGNTLDATWWGENVWLSSMYLAALRAGAEMAQRVGDNEFAAKCHRIGENGKASVLKLYNGEYFFQAKARGHETVWGAYQGCHSDQVLGQGWAWQVGLGRVLPKEQTLSALAAIYKYNFAPDIGPWREKHRPGRWYAVAGDAGLVTASNPKNLDNPYADPKAWQNIYFTECWTGIEHQVASHMLAEGMLTEGLTILKAIDDRHDASRRNPYNEIECSDHYARAMAAYGSFVSLTGFEINNPEGYLGFQPKMPGPTQQFAWVGATSWGSYWTGPVRDGKRMRLEVRHGELTLRRLKTGMAFKESEGLGLWHGDQRVEAERMDRDGILELAFAAPLTVSAGENLTLADN